MRDESGVATNWFHDLPCTASASNFTLGWDTANVAEEGSGESFVVVLDLSSHR